LLASPTNATTADRQSSQGKDGYGKRFTTPLSMAAIQATTATTLNPPPYGREAAGKNTRWNEKLPEPLPALLRGHSEESGDNDVLVLV
jgi:hypothetical protein